MGDNQEVLDLFYVQRVEQSASQAGTGSDTSFKVVEVNELPQLVCEIGEQDAKVIREFLMSGYGYGNGFSVVVQHQTVEAPASITDELENLEGDSEFENLEGTDEMEGGS